MSYYYVILIDYLQCIRREPPIYIKFMKSSLLMVLHTTLCPLCLKQGPEQPQKYLL